MSKFNYDKYVNNIIKSTEHWNKRYLTPLGKITVIKTFLLSKFNLLFLTLPNPVDSTVKTIQKLFFNFLWDGKPDKIKRKQITKPYNQGGLNMVDLFPYIQSLKLSWTKRLLKATKQPWYIAASHSLGNPHKYFMLGTEFSQNQLTHIDNPFWKNVIESWISFSKNNPPLSIDDFLTSPLWFNPNISTSSIYIPQWFNKGITTIADLTNSENQIKTQTDIINHYKVQPIDFLTFHRLSSQVKHYLSRNNITFTTISRPLLPFQLKPIIVNVPKYKKVFYYKLSNPDRFTFGNNKWNDDLNLNIDQNTWKLIYKACFDTIHDNYLIWHQYKIITRILGCKSLLYKIKISDNKLCSLCSLQEETLIHLFCNCHITISFWNTVIDWITNLTNKRIVLDNQTIILGYLHKDNNNIPINTLLTSGKSYLFQCSAKNKPPDIFNFQKQFKQNYQTQKTIMSKSLKYEKFHNIWQGWHILFEN